jgi:hypothetical protein
LSGDYLFGCEVDEKREAARKACKKAATADVLAGGLIHIFSDFSS